MVHGRYRWHRDLKSSPWRSVEQITVSDPPFLCPNPRSPSFQRSLSEPASAVTGLKQHLYKNVAVIAGSLCLIALGVGEYCRMSLQIRYYCIKSDQRRVNIWRRKGEEGRTFYDDYYVLIWTKIWIQFQNSPQKIISDFELVVLKSNHIPTDKLQLRLPEWGCPLQLPWQRAPSLYLPLSSPYPRRVY